MDTITINNVEYEIDRKDSDICLLSPTHDVIITNGFTDLEDQAALKYGYLDGDNLECLRGDVESYVETNLNEFIIKNFTKGIVIPYDK